MNPKMRLRLRDRWSPGWWSLLVLAGTSLTLPSCAGGGLFGYTTNGNYDKQYKTIRVTMVQNRTFYRGLEYMLTQELVNQIERLTPYKVVSGENADLELCARILNFNKGVVLENPNNEQRVDTSMMSAEVLLRDLRTGKILSRPPKRPGGPLAVEEIPEAQDLPPSDLPTGLVQLPTVPVPPGGPDQPAIMNNDPNAPAPLPTTAPPPGLGQGRWAESLSGPGTPLSPNWGSRSPRPR